MNKGKQVSGDCLCGAVTLTINLKNDTFGACHCGMCRNWTGSSALAVEGENATFTGEENITVYPSSEWAERGFCKKCGTHLFYRLKEGGFFNVPLGLLKNVDDLKFAMQIFIDRKPEQYSFSNDTATMTEAQVYALYAPKE